MECDYSQYTVMFKALADETRLRIINLLSNEGELCACKLLTNFNITQPTLSYHMKILTESGIISSDKKGAWIYYKINNDKMIYLKKFLDINSRG